jgi:hypothetical protein
MTNRTARKPTARKRNATAYMTTFGMPGAFFLGAVHYGDRHIASRHSQNVEFAVSLQDIRSDYERDGFEEMLWADCLEMGFQPNEIREFETNPALITSCLYVGRGMKPPVDIARLYVELP